MTEQATEAAMVSDALSGTFPVPKGGGRIKTIEDKVEKLREEMDDVLAFVAKLKAAMAKQILDSAPVQERLQSMIMEQLNKTDDS